MAQKRGFGIAGQLRAELARQRRSGRELGVELGWSERTLRRRLAGDTPITADELVQAARFLCVPVETLVSSSPADVAAVVGAA
jgi:hypothetical protein